MPPTFFAIYRMKDDDLVVPSHHTMGFIEKEFNLHRLARIHGWLWIAGRLMPTRVALPSTLWTQDRYDRTNGHTASGQPVESSSSPSSISFWMNGSGPSISPAKDCACSAAEEGTLTSRCTPRRLRECALGFLFSYAALVC